MIAFSDLTLRDGVAFTIYTGAHDPPLLGQRPFQITTTTCASTRRHRGCTAVAAHRRSSTRISELRDETVPFDTSTYVFDHVTMDLIGGKDLCLGDSGYDDARDYTIANSIIWASDGTLSAINGLNDQYDQNGDNNNVTIDHTLFKGYVGFGTVAIHNQISSDPLWVNPAGGDYRLKYPPQTLSPAINAGTTVAGVSEPFTDINALRARSAAIRTSARMSRCITTRAVSP